MFCFHKWGTPDVNRYQTCTKCGRVRRVKCSHSWKVPVGLRQTCSLCGEVRTIDCKHEWETIEVSIRNPHIGSDGSSVNNGKIFTIRCKICGEIDNRRPSYY